MVYFTRKGGKRVFCQVIIDIVHENVASPFTYQIPEGMSLEPGQRVSVPFGRMQKEGIVLQLTDECKIDSSRIRNVIGPLEDYAAIPPELLLLAEKMAQEAHCPLAETLRLMLPAQMRGGRVHVKTERTAQLAISRDEALYASEKEKRSPKRAELLRILSDEAVHTVKDLSAAVKDPGEALKKLAADGLIRLADEERLRIPASAYEQPEDPDSR